MYLFLPTTQQHKAMSNERQLQERRCLIFLCKATETPSIFYICTPREYTHCYICYSDSSCGQKKPGLPLNLCYLSYRLLYGCMDWCTIHSNKTEQMQNFIQEWHQHCRIKPTLTLIFTDTVFFNFAWSSNLLQLGPEWKWQIIPTRERSCSIPREAESRWNTEQHRKNFLFQDFCACLKSWLSGAKASGSSCKVTFQTAQLSSQH